MKPINYLLAWIARTAYMVLFIPCFIISYLLSKERSKYMLAIAISYDQLGATVFGPLLTKLMVKPYGVPIGDPDKTISHILGVNKQLGTLTKFGKFVADGLNKIDPNHVEDAKS